MITVDEARTQAALAIQQMIAAAYKLTEAEKVIRQASKERKP